MTAPMPETMRRIAEIRAELADVAEKQEVRAVRRLLEAVSAVEELASEAYPGRISVRNEARRLLMILQREAPSLERIIEAGR